MDNQFGNDPLIWTKNGNMRVSDLSFQTAWEITDDYIIFHEYYLHGDEVVRADKHVKVLKGEAFFGEQPSFG
jgi:hypothetical protein